MTQPIYFPFADGQWHISLGLKALNLKHWIEIDGTFVEYLTLKDKLLKNRHSDVFASFLESKASQKEVLNLLIEHLLAYFPQHYQQQETIFKNLATGQVWTITDFEAAPLDLAGRLVQEDLLLLQPSDEGYILVAASLCFPLRWQLREKLGCAIAQIHAPVPGYNEKLDRPVNNFCDRLKCDRPAWRLNWSIVDTPELFLPQENPISPATIDTKNAGEKLWLRVERQTLRRLQISGNIIFTIRTYVYPLRIVKNDPLMANKLAEAIQQISPEMQRYKNLLPIREALLGYLEG